MTLEHNKELVRRFDEVVARGDGDALDDLCTADMVNHSLSPSRPEGLEGTRDFLRTGMPQLNEDGWTDSVMIAEGDYVVQFGVRGGHWRGGAFLGIEADPGPYSREVAFCYRIQNNKIAERWAMRDDLTMLRQLGALTPQSSSDAERRASGRVATDGSTRAR